MDPTQSVGNFRDPRDNLPAAGIDHEKIISTMENMGFEMHPDFQMCGNITKREAQSCVSEFLEKSKRTDVTVVYLISRGTFQDNKIQIRFSCRNPGDLRHKCEESCQMPLEDLLGKILESKPLINRPKEQMLKKFFKLMIFSLNFS